MHQFAGRLIRALMLGGLLAIGQAGISSAASPAAQQTIPANGTLTVTPSLISVAIAPGGTGTTELTLHAGAALDVKIEADGLGQGLDGSFKSLATADDKSPYSARTMIAVAPQAFGMQAGGSQTVAITMRIPKDAGAGTRYAILKITGTPASSQNVGVGVELGVSSLIELTKTVQTHVGAIHDLAVDRSVPGQPLAVTGTLVNTGNSHYGTAPNQVNTSATLTNSSGQVVSTGKLVLTGYSIVPTFGRTFKLSLATAHALTDGRYHLKVDAILQDGTALDSVGLDFTVTSGDVLGATSAPAQVAAPTNGPDSGPLLLLGVLMGVLIGGLCMGIVVLGNRRRQRRPAAG